VSSESDKKDKEEVKALDWFDWHMTKDNLHISSLWKQPTLTSGSLDHRTVQIYKEIKLVQISKNFTNWTFMLK
jgi:hypothetical protein